MESTRGQIPSTAACGNFPDVDRKSDFVVLKGGMVWTRAYGKQRRSSAWELTVSLDFGSTKESIRTCLSAWSLRKVDMMLG
jgi:hypothetical protein